MYKKFFKRLLDIIGSITGIILLSIPMLVIAIVVKCDSKGPAVFKTERAGKDCKPFKFYKFRSMYTEAPKDCAPRLLKDCDSYITKVGRVLRKTSLDELPQLFCILKGDMSIIGPRPSGLSEHDLIAEREKVGANSVLPGLTGWAQVNGRDILAKDIVKKAQYDGFYSNNITFKMDCKVFFLTVKKVLKRADIQEGDKTEIRVVKAKPVTAPVLNNYTATEEIGALVVADKDETETNIHSQKETVG